MNIIEKNSHLYKQRSKEDEMKCDGEESLEELQQRVKELEEQLERKRLKDKIRRLEDELKNSDSRYESPYRMSDEGRKALDKYLYGHSTRKSSIECDDCDVPLRKEFGIPMPRTWQEFEWLTKFYS